MYIHKFRIGETFPKETVPPQVFTIQKLTMGDMSLV